MYTPEDNSQDFSFADRALFATDQFLAGKLELPAKSQYEANGDLDSAKEVAKNRIGSMGWQVAELAFRMAKVYGLSNVAPTVEMTWNHNPVNVPVIAVVGFLGEAVSYIAKNKCTNPVGARQNVAVMQVLKETLPVQTHIRSGLVASGFTDDQINKLDTLPFEIYNALFGTTNRSIVSNILNPILTGSAMAAYGDRLTGGVVAGFGLLGLPIGDWIYEKSMRTARKMEMSASSRNFFYRMKVYRDEHFPRTEKTNLLTASPHVLQGIALLFQGVENGWARMTGIGNALSGLSGLLTAMRTRYANQRTVDMTKRMIETINSDSFLFRKNNFRDHALHEGSRTYDLPEEGFQGLMVRDMKVKLPNGKDTNIKPVSFDVKKGEILVLKGKNGDGKSILFAGITQVLNHEGHVVIAGENGQQNLHDLVNETDPISSVRELITSGSVRNLNALSEIADVLAPAYNTQYELPVFDDENDELEFLVGLEVSNNLLRKEVRAFQAGKKGKEKPVFSDAVMMELSKYYESRHNWVTSVLSGFGKGGSLADNKINPERVVETLSDGEQTAMSLLSVLEQAKRNPKLRAVLLDEPLRGLDVEDNLRIALDMIDELRKVNGGLSVVMITHEHDAEVVNRFSSQVVNLSNGS